MKIYTEIGSKKRFFEMFERVNKMKLNEEELSMDVNSILNQAFESLKNGELSIQKGGSSNTTVQMGENESTINIIGIDNYKNNLNFAFKLEFEAGDQEGVTSVSNVTLIQFIFNSADGTKKYELKEDELAEFNQEHADEFFDIIENFSDVDLTKTEEPVTDELYEEAIKTIDSYPIDMEYYTQRKITQFPDGKLQTGKAYADEKPTNPDVRVHADELDKFVNEMETDDTDLTMSPAGYNSDSTLEPEVDDDQPIPELSDEKIEILHKAYDNLIEKNGGNSNYSPTRDEVRAEINLMTGKKGEIKPEKTRSVSPEAEPFMENNSLDQEKEHVIKQAILNVNEKLSQLGKNVDHNELTRLVKEEANKIMEEKINSFEIVNEDELTYPDPLGKEFKPEIRYPKKRKKHSKKIMLKTKPKSNESTDLTEEEEYGDEDISGLPKVPTGWGSKIQATKDMSSEFGGKENNDTSFNKHQLPYNTEFNLNEKEDEIEDDEPETDELTVSVPAGEMNGENDAMYAEPETADGMSQEPETDKIEQLAQDKEETGEMLQGGKGDGKSPLEFDPDQVLKGMEVEIEHSDNPMISLEIVLDHLTEDPEYYTVKDTPEDSAQQNAASDTEGDKKETDVLLGFKPHNVGDEIKTDEDVDTDDNVKWGKEMLRFHKDYNTNKKTPEEPEEEKIEDKKEDELGESKESEIKQNDPATWHQIQIAKKTIRMPDGMVGVMGGMSKEEARKILTQRGIKFNEK
jgi:hypothetical protein